MIVAKIGEMEQSTKCIMCRGHEFNKKDPRFAKWAQKHGIKDDNIPGCTCKTKPEHRCSQKYEDWIGQRYLVVCQEDPNTKCLYLSVNKLEKQESIVIITNFCPFCGKPNELNKSDHPKQET